MQSPPSKSKEATLGGPAVGDQPNDPASQDQRQQPGASPNSPPPRPPPPYVADPAQRPRDQGHGPGQEGLSTGVEDAILDFAPHQNQSESAPPARSDSSPEPSGAHERSTGARLKTNSSGDLLSDSPISSPSPAHRKEFTGAARTAPLSPPAGIGQVDSEVSFNLKYFVDPGNISFPSPRAVHFSDSTNKLNFSAATGAAVHGGHSTFAMELHKSFDKDQDGQLVFGTDADKAVLSADALMDVIRAVSAKIPDWKFEDSAAVENGDDTVLQLAKVEVDKITPLGTAKKQTFRQELDELKSKWDSYWDTKETGVDASIKGNAYFSQVSLLYTRLWTLHSATVILEKLSQKAHALLENVVLNKDVPTHRKTVYGYAQSLVQHSAKALTMPKIKEEPDDEAPGTSLVAEELSSSLKKQEDARSAMGALIWGASGRPTGNPGARGDPPAPSRGTEFNGKYYRAVTPEGQRSRSAGRDGGDDDDPGPLCDLCHRRGHKSDNCPWIPRDGKGPYCSLCGRRGHGEWDCFKRAKARPCPKCAQFGHFPEDCPDAKLKEARERRFRSPSAVDHRLRLKAGMALESSSSSEVEEVPKEDPMVVMKRQMKIRKKEATERELARVAKEETRQANMRWADLPRIRADIIYFVSNGRHTDFDSLDEASRKKVEETMLQVYVQQMAKGPPKNEEPGVSSSLKELGVDHLTQFAGNEGKYAVKPFLTKVDEIRSFKRWSPQVAAAALGQLLVGTARDWYDNLKKDMNGQPIGYDQLKMALLKEFYRKITIVEKTQIMNSLRFDVAKHRTHLAFLTECEKKSHIIADRGYILDDGSEMISRRQAREELVLMFFVSGSAPAIRFEIEHSQAETKEEIKRAVLRQEDAIRAKESNPRQALEPGYQVHEVTKDILEHEMKELGYDQTHINAVMRKRPPPSGSSGGSGPPEGIVCHYCATSGHKRYECEILKRDTQNGTIRADKCGPRQGEPPAVEALAKRSGRKSKAKDKKTTRGRAKGKRRVNAVEEDGASDEDSEEETGSTDPAPRTVAAPSGAPPPWGGWAPPPYSVVYTSGTPSLPPESAQTAAISRQGVIQKSPYDLL